MIAAREALDDAAIPGLEKLRTAELAPTIQLIAEQVHDLSLGKVDNTIYVSESSSSDQIEQIAKESGAIATDDEGLSVADLATVLRAKASNNKKKRRRRKNP